MKKRVLAGLLWFYATWYAWSIVASALGVSDMLGPVLGLFAAVLIAVDPLGRIWSASRERQAVGASASTFAEPV